jgi:hypothetical protein
MAGAAAAAAAAKGAGIFVVIRETCPQHRRKCRRTRRFAGNFLSGSRKILIMPAHVLPEKRAAH